MQNRRQKTATDYPNKKTSGVPQVLLGTLTMCILACGCTLTSSGFRTMITEPRQFCDIKDIARTNKQSHRLATEAWRDIQSQFPNCVESGDYKNGFCEGYADFLVYGGDGLTPVLPPRRYWRVKHRTNESRQAAQDWLDGFAHGIDAVQQSGLRETAAVPMSWCLGPEATFAIETSIQPNEPQGVHLVRRLPPIDAAQPLEFQRRTTDTSVSPELLSRFPRLGRR